MCVNHCVIHSVVIAKDAAHGGSSSTTALETSQLIAHHTCTPPNLPQLTTYMFVSFLVFFFFLFLLACSWLASLLTHFANKI